MIEIDEIVVGRPASPLAELGSVKQDKKTEITKETQAVIDYEVRQARIWELIKQVDREWVNPEPKKYFEYMAGHYGLPNILAPQAGGNASWSKEKLIGTPFHCITIRDEAILDPDQ